MNETLEPIPRREPRSQRSKYFTPVSGWYVPTVCPVTCLTQNYTPLTLPYRGCHPSRRTVSGPRYQDPRCRDPGSVWPQIPEVRSHPTPHLRGNGKEVSCHYERKEASVPTQVLVALVPSAPRLQFAVGLSVGPLVSYVGLAGHVQRTGEVVPTGLVNVVPLPVYDVSVGGVGSRPTICKRSWVHPIASKDGFYPFGRVTTLSEALPLPQRRSIHRQSFRSTGETQHVRAPVDFRWSRGTTDGRPPSSLESRDVHVCTESSW